MASRVFPLVAHADPFHVLSPILHAEGAISKDNRAIGNVGLTVYGLDRQ